MQDRRRKDQTVEPYVINFRNASGKIVTARVVSSAVPASQEQQESLPETFGLLVPQQPMLRRKDDKPAF